MNAHKMQLEGKSRVYFVFLLKAYNSGKILIFIGKAKKGTNRPPGRHAWD